MGVRIATGTALLCPVETTSPAKEPSSCQGKHGHEPQIDRFFPMTHMESLWIQGCVLLRVQGLTSALALTSTSPRPPASATLGSGTAGSGLSHARQVSTHAAEVFCRRKSTGFSSQATRPGQRQKDGPLDRVGFQPDGGICLWFPIETEEREPSTNMPPADPF